MHPGWGSSEGPPGEVMQENQVRGVLEKGPTPVLFLTGRGC